MGFRIKLGRHVSIGKTGIRLHFGNRYGQASIGRSGLRTFARLGPLYWNGNKR